MLYKMLPWRIVQSSRCIYPYFVTVDDYVQGFSRGHNYWDIFLVLAHCDYGCNWYLAFLVFKVRYICLLLLQWISLNFLDFSELGAAFYGDKIIGTSCKIFPLILNRILWKRDMRTFKARELRSKFEQVKFSRPFLHKIIRTLFMSQKPKANKEKRIIMNNTKQWVSKPIKNTLWSQEVSF